MADDTPDGDPEIRRRAAWLLGMLALVAALLVTLMITFFNTSGGDSDKSDLAEPTGLSSPATSAPGSSSPTTATPSGDTGSPRSGPATTPGAQTSGSTPPGGRASCPSDDPCVLDSDIGDAITAINAYRTKNGKQAVPGGVSDAAKRCALARGSGCKGGWAETELPAKNGKADGGAAVEKIKQFSKLLTDMKSIEVGWAYDPGSKTLFFATIRKT